MLDSVLQMSGYQVLITLNGAEGLTKLLQHTVDLILSDLGMPEMNGMQFYAMIRRSHSVTDFAFPLSRRRPSLTHMLPSCRMVFLTCYIPPIL